MCDVWVGFSNVYHNQVRIHFKQFYLMELSQKGNMIWRGMWIAIIWCIYNQRNCIIFRNGRADAEEVLCIAHIRFWTWIRSKNKKVIFSYSDWYSDPIKCTKTLVWSARL